ncbi:MAG: histidine--tRNA ligase [Pyrinomonadaceae bacterium]
MASTNPARGMRDFLPADVRKRNYVIGIIKEVYESYGFEPLETPAVENLETLTGKYGDEGNQLIFKILKRGEKFDLESASSESDLSDLALRYDLTVPLARVVANNRNYLPKFFKRYQIQPVWRADRPAKGRFREFYQCDVDAIGSSSMTIESELIGAVVEILHRLGFGDFILKINHRRVLEGLLGKTIPADKHGDAITALDKIDKIGVEEVLLEMIFKGIDGNAASSFISIFRDELPKLADQFPDLPMFNQELISILRDRFKGDGNERALDGLSELEQVIRNTDSIGKGSVKFDPSLARGLSYYTGAIMEVTVPDLPGSLAGGGRYDGLIGMFGKEQIPACGLSLGLERILVVMDERGMFPPEIADSTPADVMVTMWSDETVSDSLKLANDLRKQGLRVMLYPEPDKFGKQMKYANVIGVPFVGILGESEIAEGKVTLKNMKTGEQETIDAAAVSERIGGRSA